MTTFEPDWFKLQHVAYPVDNWRHVNADIHTVIEEYQRQLSAAGLVAVRREDLRIITKQYGYSRPVWTDAFGRLLAAAQDAEES